MPRKPPPAPAKGTRHPGAGRVKGQPNRISVEARQLASQLVNDVAYQLRLRRDFRIRRVHPTIESLIWAYHLGKPSQPIAVSGSMALDVNARLEEERRVFATLDIADLEQLAAESQALVDRAYKLAKMAGNVGESIEVPAEPSESLAIVAESDNGSSVNLQTDEPEDPETPS
jgi:hypothetical protein